VIVTLAAWLYIIQALLGLGSLFAGPFGGGSGSLGTCIVSAVFGAVGIGLLRRERWGRWLALGISLLSWTFGGLLLVGVLAALVVSGDTRAFVALMFSNGAMALVTVIAVVFFLIMLASVVISFKLFFHLCSETGCEEFDVPHGSAPTVAASVGTWIAIMIGQGILSGGGMTSMLVQGATAGDERQRHAEIARAEAEANRRAAERRYAEQKRYTQQPSMEVRADTHQDAAAHANSSAEPAVTADGEVAAAAEARAPVLEAAPAEEDVPDSHQILKCRDASGAVMFTQGYCPPGTKRVDMPGG
jgi:hypothetical protein